MEDKYAIMYKSDYEAICDIVRQKTGTTDLIKSGELPDKIEQIENGYDEFWDAYQRNGTRTDYLGAFHNLGWTDKSFSPKYDMKPTSISNGFQGCWITDLDAIFKKKNLIFDTSECQYFNHAFYQSQITVLPEISLENAIEANYTFCSCLYLHTIKKLIMSAHVGGIVFLHAKNLENITIDGEIGKTFNIRWSPLNLDSAKSIILHLVNYINTDNEYKYSVLFSNETWELLELDGNNAPGGLTWKDYLISIGWSY